MTDVAVPYHIYGHRPLCGSHDGRATYFTGSRMCFMCRWMAQLTIDGWWYRQSRRFAAWRAGGDDARG